MNYSVIIPIYNAEKTLKRCLDSLVLQLNSDIEVLLINDGSSDESESICKEYEEKCKSIKYYSQENSGVSAARNKGLNIATGNYILFVDSDDYVSDNYFEVINYYIQNNKPELLLFGAGFLGRQNNSSITYADNMVYTDAEIAEQFLLLYKQNRVYSLWNKAFSKQLIDKYRIRFDEDLHIGEDAVFIFRVFLYINSFMTCGDILYIVDESNQDSLSRKRRENLCNELILATKQMEIYLNDSSQNGTNIHAFKRCITWGHYRGAYACFNEIISKCPKSETNVEIIKVCDLYKKSRVKPVGFSTIIISIPVVWKMLPIIKMLYHVKKR